MLIVLSIEYKCRNKSINHHYFCKIDLNLQDGKSSFKDPLHGLNLKFILERLEAHYGFDTLGELIKIKCFNDNPTVKSSLTFCEN
jgi:hypothetical protein